MRRPHPIPVLIVLAVLSAGVVWYAVWSAPVYEPFTDKHDPIEDDPAMKPIFAAVDREVNDATRDGPRGGGYVHVGWGMKKRLLKEKHGIDWRTPAEMNPGVFFD
jgi:hypothetical protein